MPAAAYAVLDDSSRRREKKIKNLKRQKSKTCKWGQRSRLARSDIC